MNSSGSYCFVLIVLLALPGVLTQAVDSSEANDAREFCIENALAKQKIGDQLCKVLCKINDHHEPSFVFLCSNVADDSN